MYFINNFINIYFVLILLGIFYLSPKQIMPSIFSYQSKIISQNPNPLKTLNFLSQTRWPQSCSFIAKVNQRGKSDVSHREY